MKKNLLAVIACLLFIAPVFGQKYSHEFAKIGKDEIELKTYDKDKSAEAVVLYDFGKSHFVSTSGGFDVVFEKRTRIKILSEAGKKWAEVEIPFYEEGGIYERVYDVEAITYNYENLVINRTNFDTSNMYEEKVNDYWNVKKFALPNVKVGSIVEFRYKIESPYKFNLRDWEFQWRIPVVYSEYEVDLIPFYEYSYLLQGRREFDHQNSYVSKGMDRRFAGVTFNDMVHKYTMENLPAFKDEEFISSIKDYIIKIDFQLARVNYPDGRVEDVMTTWEKMASELNKNKDFGKYLKSAEKKAEKLIDPSLVNGKTDEEKFDAVMNWVKHNYKWNENFGKYASKSPAKLEDEKLGNDADLNLFAIAALRSVGISADPVLISTRDHGIIKYDYPFSHFFNYILVTAEIDGMQILSDATDALCLNHRIPKRCINDKGLLIRPDDSVSWIPLKTKFLSKVNTEIIINVADNQEVDAQIISKSTEYDALEKRENTSNDVEEIKKKLEEKNYEIDQSSIKVENRDDREKPFILSYSLKYQPETINEKIYLKPFLNETLSDNPLKQQERTYPVDMVYPVSRLYSSSFSIPKGYKLDYSPLNYKISNKLFDIIYEVEVEGNEVEVKLYYAFKKAVYSPEEYSNVKFCFDQVVKKGTEKIVLSKL